MVRSKSTSKESFGGKAAIAQALARTKDYSLAETVDYRAEIKWKDGIPYLASHPVCLSEGTKDKIQALLKIAQDLPYNGNDPQLKGLTQGEAMIINLSRDAADGDQWATNVILDRIVGKPQQKIQSVSLHGDLNEFLDMVAEDTQEEIIDVTPDAPEADETEDL